MDSNPDKTANSASVRWAVTVGDDGKLSLVLQALPSPAHVFAGKPIFKGKAVYKFKL